MAVAVTLFLRGARPVYLPMTRQTHRDDDDDDDDDAQPMRVAGRSRLAARPVAIIYLPCCTKNPPSLPDRCLATRVNGSR